MAGVESIASDLACALDAARFADTAGLSLDPWQSDVVRSNDSQIILNCHRQAGKSTTTAVLAVHTALYDPGLILLLSPSLRQSKELFRKCVGFYEAVSSPVAPEVYNKLELELVNGSRIVSLPGKEGTVRGFSGVKLLIVDEASKVDDQLYYSVRPMLAVSRGRIVLLSTPFGKRGFFFNVWTEGGHEWMRVKAIAYDCPRISKEWLDTERRMMGELWFAQEYSCEFLDLENNIFSYDAVQAAFADTSVKPLFGGPLSAQV